MTKKIFDAIIITVGIIGIIIIRLFYYHEFTVLDPKLGLEGTSWYQCNGFEGSWGCSEDGNCKKFCIGVYYGD